ncbi:MAG: hypothetical protein IJ859_00560 [Synergistaceae bacterium]|nr:hypothetical protein [Synergistaceae bacterium]MBR2207280.1 hypothetical protein [Synergistaceae bacterium]
MAEETWRTRFHYGFYAAMEVEYDLKKIPLTYEQEVELGKDPIRLDFLIIKKEPNVILHDPIGEFFKQINIFEYKSPEDGLSIDDFYKVQGYGLIYKGFGRKVNELPVENITLTIVRHTHPRDMIKMLEDSGILVRETYPGIYRFEGNLSIPVQLVISSQLPLGEYDGLRLIAKGATIEDIKNYAERAIASDNERIKENARTVIDVCLDANENLGEVKEMYEAVREVFKDAFAKERQNGINEEKERVAVDMIRKNYPLDAIKDISKLSEDIICNLATSLGLAIS